MENARSLQLSLITGSDRHYLHACLLELWREREREGAGIRFNPAVLRKRPLNARLTRYDGPGQRYEFICRDLSAAVHSSALACLSVCERKRQAEQVRK